MPIQQELGWFSVKDQLLVHAVIQMYKIVKGNAPSYLSSSNSKRSDVHNYNLNLSQYRIATSQRSFHFITTVASIFAYFKCIVS